MKPDGSVPISTLDKLAVYIWQDPLNLFQARGMGKKTIEELLTKLEEAGYDCSEAREAVRNLRWAGGLEARFKSFVTYDNRRRGLSQFAS